MEYHHIVLILKEISKRISQFIQEFVKVHLVLPWNIRKQNSSENAPRLTISSRSHLFVEISVCSSVPISIERSTGLNGFHDSANGFAFLSLFRN
ncbi:hypothetical protein X777_05645 [Ooceraea biroi]|uniref:Uncharacterized protein n=1 Tax=Ooceraea biroi TaxID=2015173 RepID=A0A026WE83_OOCBI|nr:hypothetical protein X777_05645 [Ooceraea biroi]